MPRQDLGKHLFLWMSFSAETDQDKPLPNPRLVAQKLKEETYKVVSEWNQKYGQEYKRLSLGYNFLENCKKVGRKKRKERLALPIFPAASSDLFIYYNCIPKSSINIISLILQGENTFALK